MLTMKMTVDSGNFEGKDKMHNITTKIMYCGNISGVREVISNNYWSGKLVKY